MLVYVRPSNEALLRARVPGAQDQRGGPSSLLLNRGEPPRPFLDSHEGPGFAGFGRRLFIAFDGIA